MSRRRMMAFVLGVILLAVVAVAAMAGSREGAADARQNKAESVFDSKAHSSKDTKAKPVMKGKKSFTDADTTAPATTHAAAATATTQCDEANGRLQCPLPAGSQLAADHPYTPDCSSKDMFVSLPLTKAQNTAMFANHPHIHAHFLKEGGYDSDWNLNRMYGPGTGGAWDWVIPTSLGLDSCDIDRAKVHWTPLSSGGMRLGGTGAITFFTAPQTCNPTCCKAIQAVFPGEYHLDASTYAAEAAATAVKHYGCPNRPVNTIEFTKP